MDATIDNHLQFSRMDREDKDVTDALASAVDQHTAVDGLRDLKEAYLKTPELGSNHVKSKEEKHRDHKNKDDKHKSNRHKDSRHKHHKDDKKHREDRHKVKHKDVKDKQKDDNPREVDKYKEHKHKDVHNSSSKPKDTHQSSSSAGIKLKENHISHKDSSKMKESSELTKSVDDGKLKEKINNSNSIIKPKVSSSKLPNHEHKQDKTKEPTVKPKENQVSSQSHKKKHHHHNSLSEKTRVSSDSGIQKGQSKMESYKKTEYERHKNEETKVKEEKRHKEKENCEKLKEHISNEQIGNTKDRSDKTHQDSKIKAESGSLVKMPAKSVTPVKIKNEVLSDDDKPLAERKMNLLNKETSFGKSTENKVKRVLSDDEDDKPLLARVKMPKKMKDEKKPAKRKCNHFDDNEMVKKKKTFQNKITAGTTPSPSKKIKKEEETNNVWKWWEEEKYSDGVKWRTLEHKGPVFAPEYERLPLSVKFYYNGKHVVLSDEAEEVASFYAKMLEHDYTTKEVFNKNFLHDWKKVMTPEERELIKSIDKCKFTEMLDYFKAKTEERKSMTKEEKLALKKKNEEITEEYGFCIIDGHKEKIGNFKIEPPGLFRGRGEHPKMGKLKRRIQPEDVIINCSKNGNIPKSPPGHKWKEVRHDNSVTWLASWTENVQGQTKYIMLNASSKLKGEKDWQKYEVARKLKTKVDDIRQQYQLDWKSKEMKVRQRAVALYFIDKLALRAGNEKEEGESADTVGCCSLRVEHIKLVDEKNGKHFVVEFDFLGKDSIRYQNSVPVEKRVYKNLQLFMQRKQGEDDLFDRLNTTILNKHLNELMEGLTAKVFRTFNASKTLQEQLDKLTRAEDSVAEKILAYNRANRAVAILCNHQRAVPKTFDKSMENLQNKILEKKDQIALFEKECRQLRKDVKRNPSEKDKK